jgi:glutathione S-transferase
MPYIMYNFPGCPFSERVEILLDLKGLRHLYSDCAIDLSQPRPDWLLAKTDGSRQLPVLETPQGILRESEIIMRYLDSTHREVRVARSDPFEHATECLFTALTGPVNIAGYTLLKSQLPAKRKELSEALDVAFASVDSFLNRHAKSKNFLFDRFGWAEAIFVPALKRLWCVEYFDDYSIPQSLTRLHRWRDAALDHPSAQLRSREEIVKLYFDYSRNAGSGALAEGRKVSSFALTPHWRSRPWPPQDKLATVTDHDLGLLA